MIQVRNLTSEIQRLGHRYRDRPLEDVVVHAIHRISFAKDPGVGYFDDVRPCPDDDLMAIELALRFFDRRKAPDGAPEWAHRPGHSLGGRIPYHFLLRADGVVDQLCEVGDMTPHAGTWNQHSVATAIVGDPRHRPLTPRQWETLGEWVPLWTAWGAMPRGHDELAGGSEDPSKVCPGPLAELAALRALSCKLTLTQAEKKLRDLGVVF